MARLSRNQVSELIKKPVNGYEIKSAQRKKRRNNLHTQAITDAEIKSVSRMPGHAEFLRWVKNLLGNNQNYQRYEHLYRPPVPTNELAESIFSEFQKVFEAHDQFFKFEFTDPEFESDFEAYRDKISDEEFMQEDGFATFKGSIDSFVVIDMPSLQYDGEGNPIVSPDVDPLPEPYPCIIDIDRVIDADATKKRLFDPEKELTRYAFNVEYIIYHDGNNRIIAIDDDFYRVFLKEENTSDYVFKAEYAHGLGFCPAKSFWNTPLNERSIIQKLGRIDNSLSEMDWLLFWKMARKYLEMYAPFPIYVKFKEKCNYIDEELGARCNRGILEYTSNGSRKTKQCPKCNEKISPGPGNVFEVDSPQAKDDVNLLEKPMTVIPAEEVSLTYIDKRDRELEEAIFYKCVGRGSDPPNDQAQNEKQIQAQFESRQNVLLNVKRNFEIIHHFILDTICRLRYGDNYIQATVNYGTEFFLKDAKAHEEEYKMAKDNGLPLYELAARRKMIYHAKYKNNPDKLERSKILSHLEPYPDLTISELLDLKAKAGRFIDDRELFLKLNFNTLIDKFEREQISILQFGRLLEMNFRISRIKEVLMSYVDEMMNIDDSQGSQAADIPDAIDVEAEAKARLKGSVGGVQGILQIQESVLSGKSSKEAAIATLFEIYGFERDIALKLLQPSSTPPTPRPPSIPQAQ